MDIKEAEAAAVRAGLELLFRRYPDEITDALELAKEQRDALQSVSLKFEDAP